MRTERPFLIVVVTAALLSSACSTVIKPTRPDVPFEAGPRVAGLRFDGDNVEIREPGMPVSGSRAWQREVGNFAASKLNLLLQTEETAPPARTIVAFDLAGPSAFQIGTHKEMTIEITSVLPGGEVVRSEPVTGNIDNPLEWAATQGLSCTGSVLDVGAAIAGLYFTITGFNETACIIFAGTLLAGLALNVGQSFAAYLVALSEEARWSNLFAEALKQHADDVREAVLRGPRRAPRIAPPAPGAPPPATTPTEPPGELPPAPGTPPPPPLLDPADELDRQLEGGGGGAAY